MCFQMRFFFLGDSREGPYTMSSSNCIYSNFPVLFLISSPPPFFFKLGKTWLRRKKTRNGSILWQHLVPFIWKFLSPSFHWICLCCKSWSALKKKNGKGKLKREKQFKKKAMEERDPLPEMEREAGSKKVGRGNSPGTESEFKNLEPGRTQQEGCMLDCYPGHFRHVIWGDGGDLVSHECCNETWAIWKPTVKIIGITKLVEFIHRARNVFPVLWCKNKVGLKIGSWVWIGASSWSEGKLKNQKNTVSHYQLINRVNSFSLMSYKAQYWHSK